MSGHVDGNLNFIATRKGWSRNFTLAPESVATIDYTMLEQLLELNSLKLRAARLRIFVEHPANSGTYTLLRSWKDDGSLQSSLVKGFFSERLEQGIVTILDVRDEEAAPAMPEKAREWLKTHTLPLTSRTPSVVLPVEAAALLPAAEGEDSAQEQHNAQEQHAASATSSGGFFSLFRSNAPPPLPAKDSAVVPTSTPPSPPPSDPEVELKREEDVLLARGWKPVLRRLTTRVKPKRDALVTPAHDADIMAEGDGEQVEAPDPREMSTDAMSTPDKQSLFKKSGSAFLGRRKSRKDVKGKVKAIETPINDIPAPVTPIASEPPAEEISAAA